MKVITKPEATIVDPVDEEVLINHIYTAAKLCYQTEKPTDNLEKKKRFLRRLLNMGHTSPFEHESISMILMTDRGVTHELVRHRIGAYNQESTRYCAYANNKFGNEISVMRPSAISKAEYATWYKACADAESAYLALINGGAKAEMARAVLPTCLVTRIMVTYDIPMWRHVLKQRLDPAAHLDMRFLMSTVLVELWAKYPFFFGDIDVDE